MREFFLKNVSYINKTDSIFLKYHKFDIPFFCPSSSSGDPKIALTPNLRNGGVDGFWRVPSPGDFGCGGSIGLPRGNCLDNKE